MKKEILSEDDVHKNFLSDNNVSQKKLMGDSILDKYIICRKEDSIFKENDTFLKEDIIPDESNIFEEDDNAPDCYELSALFFVYKFLFR